VKYMNFTQTISFYSEHEQEIVALAREWDEMQAEADVMGYIGSHVLRDRDKVGHYVIVAEFAVVDPNISAVEEAMKNNERPVTQEWARRMRSISDGSEPEWGNFDEIYRTG
jgi:hypothetical protein